ncbi:MAG: MFS transporter [Chthoniobacterales bacterium]|jgi:AAA family ATP:ADP antiporter|nr:MFS transporter [Chthoniobacterales bacterium]
MLHGEIPMRRIFARIVDVKPGEVRALWLAFLFNFMVLGGYYVIRPIRDEIGASSGVENLPWMFTATLIAMLIANALFSAIVAGMSRRKFIPVAYRFFIVNLLIFSALMRVLTPKQEVWLGRVFFVWLSVTNLFVVTVFWAFMTDLFSNEQGRRLFGFISIGGSLGAIIGGSITAWLVKPLGAANLFLVSAAMFEVAAQSVRFFPADFARTDQHPVAQKAAEAAIGGSLWSGVTHIARSPYLFGLFVFIILYSTTSTWAYFQQSDLAGHGFADRATRTAFLANIDRAVNTLTLLGQLFLTGRLLKWLGVTPTLLLMPALSLIGFVVIGVTPLLGVLAVFQILRRASTFAFMRPAREVLFTVLRREDKYKAKSVIDTFAYRVGDQLGAWSYRALNALGLGLREISFLTAPIITAWLALSVWLGHKQRRLARLS